MRRLAVLPLVSLFALAGCASVGDFAESTLGVPVDEVCASVDGVYAQYGSLLDGADASAEQVGEARDHVVRSLSDLAESTGGQIGEAIQAQADHLADTEGLSVPETVDAIERARDALEPFCA